MKHDTAKAINDLTTDYVGSLTKLRDSLTEELKQVNEQIRIAEEFAGIRLKMPGDSGAAIPHGGTFMKAHPGVNVSARPKAPTLTESDMQRLTTAITGE